MGTFTPIPITTTALPKGMTIKRTPRKEIEFNKVICPPLFPFPVPFRSMDLIPPHYEDMSLGTYRAVITDVKYHTVHEMDVVDNGEPLPYPQFQSHLAENSTIPDRIAEWLVKYEIVVPSNAHSFYEIAAFATNPLDIETKNFIDYIIKHGISDWYELIGCEAMVTLRYKTAGYNAAAICEHEFIYEPEGGAR